MNDDLLEARIREALRRAAPPDVPLTLEVRASRIPQAMPVAGRRFAVGGPRSWRLPAALGVVAAAVAIVALAVLTLPFRNGPAPAATWEPIGVSGLTGGTVLQVVSGPAGLLAVGVDDPSATEQHPRIWASSDGRSWRAVPDANLRTTRPDTFAVAAAPWRNGWVVVAEGAAWISADGKSWSYSDLGGGTAWGVAVSGDRIVAVGYRRLQGADNWPTPTVWVSTDGQTWALATAFEAGRDFGNFWGVTAVDGGFLAYGFVHEDATLPTDASADSPELTSAGIPWFSPDGQTWTRITDKANGTFAGSRVTQVVAGGSGFVAIGHLAGGASTPRIWTSTDGRAWQWAAGSAPFESVTDAALGLGGDGHRVVAFVAPMARRESQLWNQDERATGSRPIGWTSPDGVAWQDVPAMTAFPGRLVDVVSLGGRLFALGNEAAPAVDCSWLTPGPSSGTATASPAEGPAACNRTSAWTLP